MTCLYRHFDKSGALLYVGVSLNALQRLDAHKDASPWFDKIVNVTIERFADRKSALAAERVAIAAENPRHNIYRPLPASPPPLPRAEESRKALLRQLVQFRPVYAPQEAANILGAGLTAVNRWMDAGELGYVLMESKRGKLSRRVTGWQLIDFLEAREQRSNDRRTGRPHPYLAGTRARAAQGASRPVQSPAPQQDAAVSP